MSGDAGPPEASPTAPGFAIHYRTDDGVATVTLARERQRNALSEGLLDELIGVLAACRDDASARAVILTGAGPVFCAGADLSTVAGLDPAARAKAFAPLARRIASRIRTVMQHLLTLPKPVIAAINGHAVGGGLILTLACDLRLIAPGACGWMPELGFGRAIGSPSLATLVECVGPLHAKDIVLGRERLTADRLFQLGLVSAVSLPDDLLVQARRRASELAGCDPDAAARDKLRANERLIEIWHGIDD